MSTDEQAASNEAVWIAAARRGDEEAFAKLVRAHQARVRAYVASFVRDRTLADDLCQDAFVEAFRHLTKFRGDVPLSVWLLAIARNRAIDHLRRDVRRRDREAGSLVAMLATWHLEAAGDASDVAQRERELAALQLCIDGLPPASAALVHDHYLRGRRAVDIAEERGIGASSVRMTLLRLRSALRACVQARLTEMTRAG